MGWRRDDARLVGGIVIYVVKWLLLDGIYALANGLHLSAVISGAPSRCAFHGRR